MINKKIVFTKPNVAELLNIAMPNEIEDNQVLVKTAYSAISAGTERANFIGEINVNGKKELCNDKFPRELGYSSSGIVAGVGSKVTSVKKGDRVLVCCGKHSSYNIVDEINVHKLISDEISLLQASFMFIAGFSLLGVRRTEPEIGKSALIMGLGILGIYAVAFAQLSGASPVIAADLNPERRKLALKMGADIVLDPASKSFVDDVKYATNNKGANSVIEVTGVSKALIQSLDCCAYGGRVVLLGCSRNPDTVVDFYHQVHYPGISIVGANNDVRPKYESRLNNWTFADDCLAMQRLIFSKKLDMTPLISETYSPKQANEVYTRLAKDYKNFPIGVAFDWEKLNVEEH